MNTKTRYILTAAIGALLTTIGAQAEDQVTPREQRPERKELKEVHNYFRDARGRFDTNQDRKLDETEIAAYKAATENGSFPKPPAVAGSIPERLKKFDTDGDGTLSDAERVEFAAKALSREGHHRHGKHRGLPPELKKQYDSDNNGRLDETERKALKSDIESGKIQRPARPRAEA